MNKIEKNCFRLQTTFQVPEEVPPVGLPVVGPVVLVDVQVKKSWNNNNSNNNNRINNNDNNSNNKNNQVKSNLIL
jgi:hypothetical protein